MAFYLRVEKSGLDRRPSAAVESGAAGARLAPIAGMLLVSTAAFALLDWTMSGGATTRALIAWARFFWIQHAPLFLLGY